MVTFAQNIIVAKPTAESLRFERGFSETAAHEFAHQWFGDLVTTAWWNDIWLNESFASWMETKIIDEWKPEWTHHTGSVDARARALGSDTLMTARQVRQPIVSNDDIYNAFDAITYEKGESVLAMFEHFVGADKFRAGIRHYLTQHANGNATADDFIGAIAGAAGRPEVTPAFKTFLDQPGAPMVDVALACSAGKAPTLHVKQERFLPVGSKGSPNQTWHIPMCVRWLGADGKPQHTCALVTGREQDLTLGAQPGCPTWLLANDGEVGYYRAAYRGDTLQKLLGADGRKLLDLPETVGLLDDLRALVAAGRLPLGDALALTPSLATDDRRLVNRFVIGTVEGLHEHLVAPAERPSYERFIGKLYAQKAHALGWTPKPGEDEDTRLLRPAWSGSSPPRARTRSWRPRRTRWRSSGWRIARRSAPMSPAPSSTWRRATAIARSSTSCTPPPSTPPIATIASRSSAPWAPSAIRRSPSRRWRSSPATSSIRASRWRFCGA